ncbi:MAG: ParB/RepB/Spo0J family partition protein [Pseudomonadota bacterium]
MNAPEPVLPPLVEYLKYDSLHPSPTNPRAVLQHLNELADSIARVGILQPLLVRTHPSIPDAWEILSGHRRHAAAGLAAEQLGQEKPALPCRIVSLSDENAAEVALVENLQRDDLSPLEEALGYERLQREYGHAVDIIAERIGKSSAYVYKKLRLTGLQQDGRDALSRGQISESVALLVARIPAKLQTKAVKALTEEDYRRDAKTESMPFRQAHQLVKQQFTTDLRQAKWSLDDDTLVASAGACSACPKMAKNSPDEYPDITDGRTCMDPTCFGEKRAAHERQLEAVALEKADVKLKAGAARAALDYQGKLRPESGLVKLTDKPEGSTKTWNQLAKSAGVEVETIAVIDKERGKVLVAAKGDQLAQALKEAGVKVKAPKVPAPVRRNVHDDAELATKVEAWTGSNVAALRKIMQTDATATAAMEVWARTLLDLAFAEVNEHAAITGLRLAGVDVAKCSYDEQGSALRAALLPERSTLDLQQCVRTAVALLVAQSVAVDVYQVAYRPQELDASLSPTGIAKALGIAVDTPSASPAKGKRRKTKDKAPPVTPEEPSSDGGTADLESEGASE